MKFGIEPRSASRSEAASPVSQDSPASSARSTYALYAVCFGFFLVLLDTTALNVALADIEREFGGAITGVQWVANSYTIVFAGFLLSCGALGDRFGAKRCFEIGLFVFALMSAVCAFSPGIDFLIIARGFQGLGAAVMLPASLAVLAHTYPHPDARARAIAIWASIVSLGFAAGPALGGLLTSLWGWRSIFWINVPTGLVALFMVRAYVDETTLRLRRRIDWLAHGAAAASLFALSYALIEAGSSGWTSLRVAGAFGAAIVLGLGFLLHERRTPDPVLPGALFSSALFSVCTAIGLLLNFTMYGALFIESLYLQNERHLNALHAGLVILPFTAFPTITTRVIARYSGRRYMIRRLVTGLLLGGVGSAVLATTPGRPGYAAILTGLALMGMAMGTIMPPMTAGVLTSSATDRSGLASGILNAARQVGGTLGIAFMGTLVQMFPRQGFAASLAISAGIYLAMAFITWRIPPPATSDTPASIQ